MRPGYESMHSVASMPTTYHPKTAMSPIHRPSGRYVGTNIAAAMAMGPLKAPKLPFFSGYWIKIF